jgi:hypothetical protein
MGPKPKVYLSSPLMQKPVSGFCTKRAHAKTASLKVNFLRCAPLAASYCWQLQQLRKEEKCEKVH